MATKIFRVFRFNPKKDKQPYYKNYEVEPQQYWTVLDVLNHIKWYQDSSLSFRRSCRSGICGSCALKINRENNLACETPIDKIKSKVILIEPIMGFPVLKDLVVDLDPFFQNLNEVLPYFIRKTPPPDQEILQSPEDRKRFDDATTCILCGCCTASCPSFWYDKDYLGPAAMLRAYRFIFDSRDEGASERAEILNDPKGVYRCHTIFNCVEACPKSINPTNAIAELKKFLIGAGV